MKILVICSKVRILTQMFGLIPSPSSPGGYVQVNATILPNNAGVGTPGGPNNFIHGPDGLLYPLPQSLRPGQSQASSPQSQTPPPLLDPNNPNSLLYSPVMDAKNPPGLQQLTHQQHLQHNILTNNPNLTPLQQQQLTQNISTLQQQQLGSNLSSSLSNKKTRFNGTDPALNFNILNLVDNPSQTYQQLMQNNTQQRGNLSQFQQLVTLQNQKQSMNSHGINIQSPVQLAPPNPQPQAQNFITRTAGGGVGLGAGNQIQQQQGQQQGGINSNNNSSGFNTIGLNSNAGGVNGLLNGYNNNNNNALGHLTSNHASLNFLPNNSSTSNNSSNNHSQLIMGGVGRTTQSGPAALVPGVNGQRQPFQTPTRPLQPIGTQIGTQMPNFSAGNNPQIIGNMGIQTNQQQNGLQQKICGQGGVGSNQLATALYQQSISAAPKLVTIPKSTTAATAASLLNPVGSQQGSMVDVPGQFTTPQQPYQIRAGGVTNNSQLMLLQQQQQQQQMLFQQHTPLQASMYPNLALQLSQQPQTQLQQLQQQRLQLQQQQHLQYNLQQRLANPHRAFPHFSAPYTKLRSGIPILTYINTQGLYIRPSFNPLT
jgi:hypothetical protein